MEGVGLESSRVDSRDEKEKGTWEILQKEKASMMSHKK